jgi:hypothetical protein
MQFENIWLAWYPWPMSCVHDQGTKFIGADFQYILMRSGILRMYQIQSAIHKPTLFAKDFISQLQMRYEFY